MVVGTGLEPATSSMSTADSADNSNKTSKLTQLVDADKSRTCTFPNSVTRASSHLQAAETDDQKPTGVLFSPVIPWNLVIELSLDGETAFEHLSKLKNREQSSDIFQTICFWRLPTLQLIRLLGNPQFAGYFGDLIAKLWHQLRIEGQTTTTAYISARFGSYPFSLPVFEREHSAAQSHEVSLQA